MTTDVRRGRAEDIVSWLNVVREVEPLFGPMPTFEGTLERAVARGRAWCVEDSEGVAGGMLLSDEFEARINWLAVRASARGAGVGRALVAHALTVFGEATEVVVDTFGEDNASGRAARRLYESFGFVPAESLERGPEGGTRQRFRLARVDVVAELPASFWSVPWVANRVPDADPHAGLTGGANCQRYAYAVLRHFGRPVPALRSQELWHDTEATVVVTSPAPLDLVLFAPTQDPHGAHVGVWVGPSRVLHLAAEVGRPTVWELYEFCQRERYRVLIGAKRVLSRRDGHRSSVAFQQ